MNSNQLSLKSVFSQGWAIFWRRPGLSLGGFLAGYLIGGFLWPFIGGPMAGGLSSFLLKTARQENPDLNDLFSGFKDFWRWTGIFWLWFGIYAACLFSVMAVYWWNLDRLLSQLAFVQSRFALAYVLMMFTGLIIICAAVARWGFAFFIATEGVGVLESFRRSYHLTKPRWVQLWFMIIVLAIFVYAGVILLYFGFLLTLAIGAHIFTALYLQLKGESLQSA